MAVIQPPRRLVLAPRRSQDGASGLKFTQCRFDQDLLMASDLRQFTVRRATGRGV